MRAVLDNLCALQRAYLEYMRNYLGADCAHPKQGPILCMLLELEGTSQAELTRRLNVSAATVTVSIGRLERLGYVRRHRNPQNRRAYELTLTAEGYAQAVKLNRAMNSACKQAVIDISPIELNRLCELLERMADNLHGQCVQKDA